MQKIPLKNVNKLTIGAEAVFLSFIYLYHYYFLIEIFKIDFKKPSVVNKAYLF